ncbi:MAG: hypothetical protein ABF479_10600 [Gluconacetobacter sp.]
MSFTIQDHMLLRRIADNAKGNGGDTVPAYFYHEAREQIRDLQDRLDLANAKLDVRGRNLTKADDYAERLKVWAKDELAKRDAYIAQLEAQLKAAQGK